MPSFMSDITHILSALEQGDPSAADEETERLAVFRKGQEPEEGRQVVEGRLRLVWHASVVLDGNAVPGLRQFTLEGARRVEEQAPSSKCPLCGSENVCNSGLHPRDRAATVPASSAWQP